MQNAFGSLAREYDRARILLNEFEDELDALERQHHPVSRVQSKKLNRQLRFAHVLLHDLEGMAVEYPRSPAIEELLDDVDRQLDRCERLENYLRQIAPPVSTAEVTAIDNLPPADLFVGRETEIAQCLEGLSPQERGWGVIIDGQGGLGKTSLALALAHRCRKEGCFGNYLWLSAKTTLLTPQGIQKDSLAPTSLDALLDEVGRLLGVEVRRLPSVQDKRQRLERALQGTRSLIILDNLETLTAEDRGEIGEFLRHLPRDCKAIVTSRRRSGESALTVRLDRLSWKAARELCLRLAEGDASVGDQVAQIGEEGIRQLYEAAGGSPLALRWTLGLMSEKGYSFRGVLDLLNQASQASDLHDFVFTEALEQMTPEGHRAFSALALFRIPATVPLLAAASALAPEVVRTACEQLLLLSLVESEPEHERFHLLPLTRSLVLTRVDVKSGFRFAQAWVDFARTHGGDYPQDFTAYDQLEAQWPNLEGAVLWLIEASGASRTPSERRAVTLLVDLLQSLRRFLWFRGYWNELLQFGKQAFEVATAAEQWLGAMGSAQCVLWVCGPYARYEPRESTQWMQKLLDTAARAGCEADAAVYRQRSEGIQARLRGAYDRAEANLQAVLQYCLAHGTQRQVVTTLGDLGGLHIDRQDYDQAAACYYQAYTQAHHLPEERAGIALNLGLIAFHRTDFAGAERWLQEGLDLARKLHQRALLAEGQFRLARVYAHSGREPEADELLTQALVTFERLRHTSTEAARTLKQQLPQPSL